MQNWQDVIFSGSVTFEEKVRQIFDYQFEHNAVYRRFCEALGQTPRKITCHPELVSGSEAQSQEKGQASKRLLEAQGNINAIPLLPIQAFKDTEVITVEDNSTFNIQNSALIFQSSGTGSMQRSKHYVADADLYRTSILKGFRHFYDLTSSVIWGYTPGYADNPHSSLIWMINELIEQDESGLSQFLPLNEPLKAEDLQQVEGSGKMLILFGAAFGLLDLVEASEVKLPSNSIVVETGGMKTHRREITRKELHCHLAEGFGINEQQIHSEYGMAELLSQAYATGGKWFRTVPWMQVSIRNPENPVEVLPPFYEGLIGIIDLANVHSCSFILTGDKGVMDKKGRFQILGRWSPKDLRGCNFLIDED